MLRSTLLIALACTPFVALARPGAAPAPLAASAAPAQIAAPCDNLFDQEPVLVFDVSGYGLAGLIHQHVCVYDSGLVTYAEAGGGTPLFPFGSSADITYVPVEKVRAFQKSLILAGAFSICDEDALVADAPLHTVTVFRGQTDSRAHTYSYWFPISQANTDVHALILAFIDDAFPN